MAWTVKNDQAEFKKETVTSYSKAELQDVKLSLEQDIAALDAKKKVLQAELASIDSVISQLP